MLVVCISLPYVCILIHTSMYMYSVISHVLKWFYSEKSKIDQVEMQEKFTVVSRSKVQAQHNYSQSGGTVEQTCFYFIDQRTSTAEAQIRGSMVRKIYTHLRMWFENSVWIYSFHVDWRYSRYVEKLTQWTKTNSNLALNAHPAAAMQWKFCVVQQ